MPIFLSKSRVIAGWQCAKQLWLIVHRPDLAPEAVELFQFVHGNEVQKAAWALIPDGIMISRDSGLSAALDATQALLGQRKRQSLFEATFSHDNVLIRADILRPTARGAELVEIKSATEVKDYYLPDCAIQAHVIESAGVRLNRIKVAHVDNQFIYRKSGDYRGLLKEVDVTEGVRSIQPEIPRLIRSLRRDLKKKDEPDITPGPH